jgi:hypothetical protein
MRHARDSLWKSQRVWLDVGRWRNPKALVASILKTSASPPRPWKSPTLNLAFGLAPDAPLAPPMISGPIVAAVATVVLLLDRRRLWRR